VGRLGEYLNEINGSETLLAKLEKMFNVSLELEGDYLLIVGTEQNINGVKKKISSTELQSGEESVESIEENPKKQHQEQ
jgi:phosphate starvation-inducible protein PhoH